MITATAWMEPPYRKRVLPSFDNIDQLAVRDEQVFEEVFKSLFKPLWLYANSLLKDEAKAEDVVHQVFLRLWEKADSLQYQDSVKAYLYRSVRNECLNQLKHQKVTQTYTQYATHAVAQHTHTDGAGQQLHARELEQRIASSIARLPEQCRNIFEMSRFGNMKYHEIADALDISIKTVEAQMGKALKWMRTQLADYLPTLVLFLHWLTKNLIN